MTNECIYSLFVTYLFDDQQDSSMILALLGSHQQVVWPLRRFSPPLAVKCLSSSPALYAKSERGNRGQKLLPPEERLGYLKTAEKRYANGNTLHVAIMKVSS